MPARRREWGEAMRAELPAIGTGRARWRFAVGCLRVAAVQPEMIRGIGYPLLGAGVLAATATWAGRIAYPLLHWGLLGLVAGLLAMCWLGRWRSPVGRNIPARLIRAGGVALVGVWTAGIATFLAGPNRADQAGAMLPVFAVLLAVHLLGFLTVTARRSPATSRVLAAGAGCGAAAAAAWVFAVFGGRPIPVDIGPGMMLIAVGMAVAAAVNAGRHGRDGRGLLAALFAGTTGTMLVVTLIVVLSRFGPASMIPDLAPAALSPADDLAQSRNEVQDPYVAVMFLSCLIAALQTATTLVTRRARAA
jgi:hypothetical protein